jgi:hypothetical protein
MGQIQKAMEVYEKAMDIAPDNDEAKQGRLSFGPPYITIQRVQVSDKHKFPQRTSTCIDINCKFLKNIFCVLFGASFRQFLVHKFFL